MLTNNAELGKVPQVRNCIHGLVPEHCRYCHASPSAPNLPELSLFAFRPSHNEVVTLSLTLHRNKRTGFVTVFVVSPIGSYGGPCYLTVESSEIDTGQIALLTAKQQQDCRAILRQFALEKGLLFDPEHPLTLRERGVEGPSHCWHCQRKVSFERGSLGCAQCGYYVCPDGYCCCGMDWSTNYLNQRVPPQPPLTCEWKVRRAAAVIVMGISKNGELLKRNK